MSNDPLAREGFPTKLIPLLRLGGLSGLLLLVSLCWCERAGGGEPGCFRRYWTSWGLLQPCPACPDDYCPKKLPCCPYPVRGCGADDYCPKNLPITCFLKYCGPDDYCPKLCPPLPLPGYPPWYTCGPAAQCGPLPCPGSNTTR